MKKKLNLDQLEVQSFVTTVRAKPTNEAGGVDVVDARPICGWTLCPPCTQDPLRCLLSDTVCTGCIDKPHQIGN